MSVYTEECAKSEAHLEEYEMSRKGIYRVNASCIDFGTS